MSLSLPEIVTVVVVRFFKKESFVKIPIIMNKK